MALTIAGFFFDLGYHQYALEYFQHSTDSIGHAIDTHYNKTVYYYQLRQDENFTKSLDFGKKLFPNAEVFARLDNLDLEAK